MPPGLSPIERALKEVLKLRPPVQDV